MELENFKKAEEIQHKIEKLDFCLDELKNRRRSSETVGIVLNCYMKAMCDDKVLSKIYDIFRNEIYLKRAELEKEFMDL